MVGVRRKVGPAAGREAAPPPVLDLDMFRLCGVGCGDPAAGLAALGSGSVGAGTWEIEYPAHGLTVEIRRGVVRAFHAHVAPTPGEVATGMRPFAGAIRHRGEAFDPARITSEAAAIDRFGAPVLVAPLTDGWALTFETGRVEWEVLLSADGRLSAVGVYGRA